jgi:hypothetical protein
MLISEFAVPGRCAAMSGTTSATATHIHGVGRVGMPGEMLWPESVVRLRKDDVKEAG